ncbi:hypothetical protein [Neobacillus sp. NPDC093127]|uniref:hypothetical protein n=1 Tax=Neobacillus sp. NPDC093127 TaxID=3364296 RepID=UPI00380C0996
MSTNNYENLFNRMKKSEKVAENWTQFINQAVTLFIQKDTDYESRFMRGMMELDARTLWAWEVDKKLDRLRSWIKRGELQVKDEGIRNSVDDLFIYTVQYVIFVNTFINYGFEPFTLNEWKHQRIELFTNQAVRLHIGEWIEFLEMKGRISQNDALLKLIIRMVMGGKVTAEDWRKAILA